MTGGFTAKLHEPGAWLQTVLNILYMANKY